MWTFPLDEMFMYSWKHQAFSSCLAEKYSLTHTQKNRHIVQVYCREPGAAVLCIQELSRASLRQATAGGSDTMNLEKVEERWVSWFFCILCV